MIGPRTRAGFGGHIGGRAQQQDNAVCFASRDGSEHLVVVADGMGGRVGGEMASRIVVETATRLWPERPAAGADVPSFLERLCQEAHAEIRRRAREAGEAAGATIAALLARPARAWWVHVGDSRVYAFRGATPVSCTEDHTVVQQLVRTGRISAAEAAVHPDQHKLLRGLGSEDTLHTTHGQMLMTPDIGFVLCTDGFWTTVRPDEMATLLDDPAPQAACGRWAEVAARRGGAGGDNTMVAVLQPAGRPALLRHRQLWPLYAALAVAAAAVLFHAFR